MKIIPDSLQLKKLRKDKINRKGRKLVSVGLAVFLSLLGTKTLAQTIILSSIELEHKDFKAQDQIAVDTGLYTLESPRVEIIDVNGKEVDINAQIIDKKKVVLKQKKHLKPGKYKFIIYDNNKVVFNEDFTWGVLAINTNKSIYTKGDTALFSMAVLDARGNMVCDADVELTVENEDADFKQTLKTSSGEIRVNPECQMHDFTLKPDYEARLATKHVGEYKLTLTAQTKARRYTVYDQFSVEKEPAFDIERRAATRLYPVKTYPVEIIVKANKEFKGFAVEQVPQSFEVLDHPNARKPEKIYDSGETKTLVWSVDLSKNEIISLGYVFDPPDKSPDTFQSGKLKLVRDAKIMQDALDALDIVEIEQSSQSSQAQEVQETVDVLEEVRESSVTSESSESLRSLVETTQPNTQNTVENVQITEFEETRFWIYANDAAGSGAISVTPTSTTTTSIQETFTFTFDPSETMDSGGLAIKVPTSRGWSAPQGTAGTAGYVTATGSGNATVGVSLVKAEADPEGNWNWGEDDTDACNNNTTSTGKVYEGTYSVTCVNFNDTAPDDTDSVSWENSGTVNWSGYSQIGFWIYTNKALDSTDGIDFGFDDSADMASPIATTNLGTIPADSWVYKTITLSGTRTAVKSFGLISKGNGFDNNIIYMDEVIIGSGNLTFPANGSDYDIQMRFVDLASTETVTITYGAGGGNSGVTPPSSTGTDTFTTRTMITSADSFVNISSHPTIQVNEGITVAGTCKQSDQITNCTDAGSISVATNATLQTPTQATVAGTWTVYGIPKPSTNDVITVFISGAGESDEAVGVTTYDGSGNVAGIELIAQRLTIGNSDNRTVSNANLNQYDSDSTEDIFYTVDNSTYALTVTVDGNKPNSELYILSGNTYRPDSSTPRTINVHDIEINGTLTADGTTTINLTGSWDNNGTFTAGTSTVTFGATAVGETVDMGGTPSSNAFNNVVFDGAGGGWTLSTHLDANGALTITTGTLNQSTFNINVAGNVLINTNGVFTKGSGSFTFDGTTASTWTNNGTIDNLGAVTINKTDTTAPATNNKVTLGSSVKADTITINGTSGQADNLDLATSGYILEMANAGATGTVLTVSGTLTIGTSTVKYSATNSGGNVNINNLPYSSLEVSGAETYVLTGNQTSANAVTGNISIGSGATLDVTTTPYNITLNGNWTNSGTFTARTGTVSIGGSGTSTLSGTTTFYTFNSTAAGKTIKFQKHTANVPYFTFSNQFVLTGASGNKINLESDTNGSQWLANFATAQTGTTYVNLKDAGCYSGTATINMSGTGNSNVSGNNTTCWIFNTAPGFPSGLAQKRTNDTSISLGLWINEQSVKFTATASDTDNPDTLYLCIEIDQIGTAFSNTEDSCASSGTSYTGSPVALSHTISSIPGDYSYHWQARVKDSSGAYSSWVSYGGNAESERDVGVDITAPVTGTVYDGNSAGVDIDFNDGSLSTLYANWSGFNDSASGVYYYRYDIGTTAGGTQVAGGEITYTTSFTYDTAALKTSQMYYVTIRAINNAGSISSSVTSDGQTVAPTLSFYVSPSSVTFSNLNALNSYTDTKTTTLTTSTNAYNGYVVRAFQSSLLTSFSNPSITIANFSGGSYASPDEFLSGDLGFGYTSSDTSIQGSNKFGNSPCAGGGNPPCYAPFASSGPGDIVADHTSTVTGTDISNEQFTITYKVRVTATQAATKYSTNIIYTVIPTF